ncbi:MAG: mechanosensitive ion channel family protein [Crocinitomicaceae bacterium]
MFKTIENKTINEILNFSLIEVDKYQLKISTVIVLSVFILFIIVFLKFLKKLINRSTKFDQGKKYSIFNLFKYFTLVFTIVFSLQIIGLDVSVLLAGSAALLVGIGFGLQNVFSDFISGIIILVDASVKVNDVIELNGLIGSVTEINFRTTTVMTRDEKYIIIPNSQLTSSQLINWSHSKITSRFEVSVGVDYSSDVEKVIQLLEEAVKLHPKVLRTPKPFVRFTEFADSSLNFTILFWSNDLFRIENVKSEIRIEIFKLFKKNGIQIPFPQRVVHMPKGK